MYYKKIVMFDFDDTLCVGNSHLNILKDYYKRNLFENIFAKGFGKIFPLYYQKFLDKAIEKIPKYYIKEYKFNFRQSAMTILNEKTEQGYKCIIITYAPMPIVEALVYQLDIPVYKAPRGRKDAIFKKHYTCDILTVCTDNVDDSSLLDIADEQIIYVNKRTRNYFKNRYPNALLLEEDCG